MDIKKITKKHKIWALTIAILLVLVLVFILNNQGGYVGERATSKNETNEEISKREENKADKSLLLVSLNQELKLETGSSQAIMNIENLPENNYDIKVQIIMRDKEEVKIYESGKIKPGYMVKEVQLDKKLDKGNYGCVARVLAYDNDGKQVKSADIQVNLTVEK